LSSARFHFLDFIYLLLSCHGSADASNKKSDRWKNYENRILFEALEEFKLMKAVGGDDKAYAKLLQRYKRPVLTYES
jgi:hypothetical protein